MELAFQQSAVTHLQKLASQTASQEETAEATVPDGLPDVGRVVGCWGVPVIRSKQWQQNTMGISGGITAWVLYVPEDGSAPRQVPAYLSFSMRWDLPHTETQGSMRISCRLKSIDARAINARKILVRASISCQAEAFCPGQTRFYTLENPPKDLEVLRSRLPLLLPTELSEKSFLVDEEIELPGGAPPVAQIIAYQISPVLNDSKVLGEKAVFKGSCGLHLVYMTPEDRLAVWDFDLPFSQYAELEQNYDQEEELQTELIMTGAEVTAGEDGKSLHFTCSLSAQCLVLCRQTVDLVKDMYSLRQTVTPKLQTVPIKSRLDRQNLRVQTETAFPIGGGSLMDCTFLPGLPNTHREGESVVVEAPVWCSIIYYDADGALQGSAGSSAAQAAFPLAEGCPCEAAAVLSGPVQWSMGGGTATVRGTVALTVDSFSNQELTFLSGAELGEPATPDAGRPSLIIRTPAPEEDLWSLAKACGSTIAAIQGANHLTQEALDTNRLLLIPVL